MSDIAVVDLNGAEIDFRFLLIEYADLLPLIYCELAHFYDLLCYSMEFDVRDGLMV